MDLTQLTDDELDEHRRAVIAEQERRQALANIPEQIADLTEKYAELGGNPDNLKSELDGHP